MKNKMNIALLSFLLILNSACGSSKDDVQPSAQNSGIDKVELNAPERMVVLADSVLQLKADKAASNRGLTFKWTLGDKIISTQADAKITSNTLGEQPLTLEVKDGKGRVKLFSKRVFVAKNQEKEVLGYIPHYRDRYEFQHWKDNVTMLSWAFARVNDGGKLNMMLDAAHEKSMKDVISKAHQAGIRVLLSLGMGRGDQKPAFSKAVIDEKQRAVIVKDALDLLKKYEFDGVDVDFEGWDNGISTDREKAKGLGILWTELRSKLPKTYLLTAALSMIPLEQGRYTSEMLQLLDYCNVMTYDKTGPWSKTPGPHAPYEYFKKGIQLVVDKGISKSKILPGIPFYGIKFKSATSTEGADQRTWKTILATYPKAMYNNEWLEENLYYDGPDKIRKKVGYVKDEGIRGVMIWELTEDYYEDTSKSLLYILNKALKQK